MLDGYEKGQFQIADTQIIINEINELIHHRLNKEWMSKEWQKKEADEPQTQVHPLVNVAYPAYLMTRHKSWAVFKDSGRDFTISVIFGIQFIAAMILLGRGMLYLGVLGASVGWGIMQGMQILGSIAVGFIAGEWIGVHGKPLNRMCAAVLIMVVAIVIIAYGNTRV